MSYLDHKFAQAVNHLCSDVVPNIDCNPNQNVQRLSDGVLPAPTADIGARDNETKVKIEVAKDEARRCMDILGGSRDATSCEEEAANYPYAFCKDRALKGSCSCRKAKLEQQCMCCEGTHKQMISESDCMIHTSKGWAHKNCPQIRDKVKQAVMTFRGPFIDLTKEGLFADLTKEDDEPGDGGGNEVEDVVNELDGSDVDEAVIEENPERPAKERVNRTKDPLSDSEEEVEFGDEIDDTRPSSKRGKRGDRKKEAQKKGRKEARPKKPAPRKKRAKKREKKPRKRRLGPEGYVIDDDFWTNPSQSPRSNDESSDGSEDQWLKEKKQKLSSKLGRVKNAKQPVNAASKPKAKKAVLDSSDSEIEDDAPVKKKASKKKLAKGIKSNDVIDLCLSSDSDGESSDSDSYVMPKRRSPKKKRKKNIFVFSDVSVGTESDCSTEDPSLSDD